MSRQPRIRGAVRAMNQLRARLAAGLVAEEQAAFRAEVNALLAQIEAVCRQQGGRPEDLPTPSYRAYGYLQALVRADLATALPAQRGDEAQRDGLGSRFPSSGQARVVGLVAQVEGVQEQLRALAEIPAGQPTTAGTLPVESQSQRLREKIAAEVAAVEALCRKQNALPVDLPVRSRRAYQWLAWLALPGSVESQIEALALLHGILQDPAFRARLPRDWRKLPARARFYHQSRLLRAQVRTDLVALEFHQALVGAPPADLADFARAALLPRSRAAAAHHRLGEWARGEAFQRAMVELERFGSEAGEGLVPHRAAAGGAHHHLAESFERVNQAYFSGELELPQLAWNRTITHRMLGNYQVAADRITLSQTLDDPRVPAWFIDFVIYHEALHKHLGIPCQGGRRRAHTAEFRRWERRFARYADAQDFMRQMGSLLGL